MAAVPTFGENLRRARNAKGLTQEAVAARLGFKRTTPISIWERGAKLPGPKTIVKLAAAIGCQPEELMAGVITPYDAIRGGNNRTAPKNAEDLLTDDDRQWLRLGRALPLELRRRYASTLAALIRAIRAAVDPRPPTGSPARPGRRAGERATSRRSRD